MRLAPRLLAALVVAAILLLCATAIVKPALLPTYAYYHLIGRLAAPLPPDVEQYVLQSGQEYCAQGHDSECGGYRVSGGRALAVGPAAMGRGVTAAWCVDYVTLRRNLGRTRDLIYWSKIPGALVVSEIGDGSFESYMIDRCAAAVVE
jgi:hypothetical protein